MYIPDSVYFVVSGLLVLILGCITYQLGRWGEARSFRSREAELEVTLKYTSDQVAVLGSQSKDTLTELVAAQSRILYLEKQLSGAQVRLEDQLKFAQQERVHQSQTRATLASEFENLAHQILNRTQKQHLEASKSSWETAVAPYKEQLNTLLARVAESQKIDSEQRSQLLGQVIELQKQSQSIGQDAVNLTNVLKGNNKAQGIWGEMILERVLEQSGLVAGREYVVQENISAQGSSRLIPDAVIHLPQERKVVVDAKVSLVAYERLATGHESCGAQKALVESIRAHIRSLSSKHYWDALGAQSLDFVIMFVPLESAFVTVAQAEPGLLEEAYSKRVVMVSPSSLMAVVKTIESLWARQRQDMNVEKIVDSAGKLYDQFVLFGQSMLDVSDYLDKATTAQSDAIKRLSSGRGNLVRKVEQLKELGAKTGKTVPKELVEASGDCSVEERSNS